MVALRSKEFVGKAEGIKSHELSVKSLIESLKGTLSKLGNQKRSIESRISSLYAELAAAENDTDEDGEPDYGLIASIENQIDQANDELDDTEQEISETSGELGKAEREFEQVEEEKQQTLFEIQQRARTTSQNLSSASSMYGAYADVGASLNRSFQVSFDALAQAAAILDGSVCSTVGSISAGGTTNTHSRNGVGISGASGSTAAIVGVSHIASSCKPNYQSNQPSAAPYSAGKLRPNNSVSNWASRIDPFHTSQASIRKTDRGSGSLISAQLSRSTLDTTQTEHTSSANAPSAFASTKEKASKQTAHDKSTKKREISSTVHPSNRHFTMNTPRTIEEMRAQMNEQQKAYFDEQIAAGGGVSGQKAHLQGAGKEFYLTSSSEKKASGNFLTQEHPGFTAKERKENLQLPYDNDASVVDKVRSVKAAVVLISQISAQEKWAKQSGYTARTGMEQVFTPNLNMNGAIAAGIYTIVTGSAIEDVNVPLMRGNNSSNQNNYDISKNKFADALKVTTRPKFYSVMGLSIEDGSVANDFIGAVYSRYYNSERTSRAIFDYAIKSFQITIKTVNADVECYDPRDRGLYLDINYDKTDPQDRGSGYFHEFGHALDHALGGNTYLSNNNDFLDALQKDYKEVLVRFKSTSQKARNFLNFLHNPVAYPISDLLEGLSNGAISGGYGHMEENLDYWEHKYSVCNEAFAHFFEASMGSNERLKYIKLVFPNAYDQYQKMIAPFVSKGRAELERER